MSAANPYDWTHHRPQRELVREPALRRLVSGLLDGNGHALVGGRGMGKSVILHQVAGSIEGQHPFVKVIDFPAPPVRMTIEASLEALAWKLGLTGAVPMDAADILDQYFSQHPEHTHCVLLYDELDQYAAPKSRDSLGRMLFNHLEGVRRHTKRLGILAAGGLGIYVLRDYLASSFMSRVEYASPQLFTSAEIEGLSLPFAEEGRPLAPGVIDAISLASGGNPALVTYALQRLWDLPAASEADVAGIYAELGERNPEFLRDIRNAVSHPDFSEVPLRVWAIIQRDGPRVARGELLEACRAGAGALQMNPEDVMRLLRGAGLILQGGPSEADPLDVRAVASILNLPAPSTPHGSPAEQLVADLRDILTRFHTWAPDFFRQGQGKGNKVLVPEANFTSFLGLGLTYRGWVVEREALQGDGRTDLKLTRAGHRAVVEVKIWGRNDFAEIHAQLEGYWVEGVVAAAAVTITDKDLASFADDYRRVCLGRADLTVTTQPHNPPLSGHFAVESTSKAGFAVRAAHLLLRLPR